MEQKTKLMLYLLFGINFLISITFCSCERKVDYEYKGEYIYKNRTNYPIKMSVFNKAKSLIKEYEFLKSDSISINLAGDGVAPFHYDDDVKMIGDSVSVVFGNQRYLSFIKEKNEGVFSHKNYDNYTSAVDAAIHFTLYYTFDSLDFNAAIPIK